MGDLRDRLTRIEGKLEKLSDGQADQNAVLKVQAEQLTVHIKRTNLLEESLGKLREEFKPVSTHVAVVGALGKVIAVIASLVGIGVGISKLLGH